MQAIERTLRKVIDFSTRGYLLFYNDCLISSALLIVIINESSDG